MIKKLSIIAALAGAFAAAQFSLSLSPDVPSADANRFAVMEVPAVTFANDEARWAVPES